MYVVSAWDGEKLVGFSRAISDGVTNGYIGTVVVHADYRKRGIGRALVLRILGNRDGVQFVLHARPEVHDFYLKLGFEPAKDMFRRRRKF
jgi:ribosomal protein S18 acetylase RimI-like enzyme